MQFELNLYSKYRTELMGMAAILVIFSHVHDSGVDMYEPIRQLFSLGASGVELFLFVSGFGLWKSYHNATDGTYAIDAKIVCPWYKKRFLRILIPYLLFALPIYGVLTLEDHSGIMEYIRRVTFVSFWTQGWGLWYVAMLFPLYFLAPFLIRLLSGEYKVSWLVVLLLLTELFAYFAFGVNKDVYYTKFIMSRLPSFYIGVFMAQAICEEKKSPLWLVLFIPLALYFLLRGLNHALDTRFFYLWILPLPFSTIGVWLLARCKWLQALCKFMGVISLEIYCTHSFVPMFMMRLCNVTASMLFYLFGIGVSILLSVGINRLSKMIINKMTNATEL